MKHVVFFILLSSFFSLAVFAQKSEVKAVKQVILEFVKAGDANNAAELASHLDDNFRIVMNRLFGSSEVSVMSREVYLEKVKSGEYGGDTRKVSIEDLVINGTTASARVTMKGTKMTFTSLITLIQNAEGQWKLVSDVPVVR